MSGRGNTFLFEHCSAARIGRKISLRLFSQEKATENILFNS